MHTNQSFLQFFKMYIKCHSLHWGQNKITSIWKQWWRKYFDLHDV